jgi:uncharacterized protein (DUF2147 family)
MLLILSILLLPYLDCSFCHAWNQDAIIGKWRDLRGTIEIEIYKNIDKYHAKIIWMKEPNYRENDHKGMAGKPKIDRENPDPSLRNRPLLNMDLLWGCVFKDSHHWGKGTLYDPLKGKTYQCSISMDKPDWLMIRGYSEAEILCKTMLLKRIKG